ncbi:MAG TPA: ABC transporter substrate-binding protein [Aestuariivirga sp.]|nr:ABC transporter substrate-binding protein [Aestuariivirga sp.]
MAHRASGSGRGVSRRAALFAAASLAFASPAHAEHPSVAYMRKVAKDLLNAHRQGTVASFRRAILRHAAIPEIADYSLGQYRSKLPASQKDRYYGGVATFMARYFADQSRDYKVAKYEIGDASGDDNKEVLVNTRIVLMSGQKYTVVWRLGWRGGHYKVLDAKVLGFSLVYLQRGLFTSFVSKRNGNVGELVAALNR